MEEFSLFDAVLAAVPFVVAVLSLVISIFALRQAKKLQKDQWRRNELELRRDVLRRLAGYAYRLTPGLKGTDGEPFVALNEAWVVFAGFPDVVHALRKMHDELAVVEEGRLASNITVLVKAMASAAEISTEDLTDDFIQRPFTPPPPKAIADTTG